MATSAPQDQSSSGCLLRLFWMFLGNALLGLIAINIVTSSAPLLSLLDVIYWLLVGLVLWARYADIQYFKGTTADGSPASLQDFRRHALILLVFAMVVWVVLHLFAASGT